VSARIVAAKERRYDRSAGDEQPRHGEHFVSRTVLGAVNLKIAGLAVPAQSS